MRKWASFVLAAASGYMGERDKVGSGQPPLWCANTQKGPLHPEGGGEFEFKCQWTCKLTSRKYHLANHRCAASRRVSPELCKYGNQALSEEWTLCKLC